MACVLRSIAVFAALARQSDAASAKMALRGESTVHSLAAPDQAAARSLLTLDLNHDGAIDSSEVAAFAKGQGYDSAPAAQEFMGFDANRDGSLDMAELSSALSRDASVPKVPPEQLPVLPAAKIEAATSNAAAASEIPAASTALLAEELPQKREKDDAKLDAQASAALVAHELSIAATKQSEARSLDLKAAELRANSTAFMQQTSQRVLEAGSKAASDKATQLLQTLAKLENEAEEAEVQAAALRAKSGAELEQANDYMVVANAALGTSNLGV